MKNKFLSLLSFFIINSFFLKAQNSNSDVINVKSKIEYKNIEGLYNIKATANNNSSLFYSLTYTMLSLKKGSSGNMSSSKQSGKFTLEPNETKSLSETNINLQKKDALKVYLFINDEKTGKLISKDSLEVNQTKFEGTINRNEMEKELESKLGNITVNETKTIVGENFYNKLYNYFMLYSIKYDFIIKVTELPSFGRSTQISIVAGDDNVFTFSSKPDEDYLDENVKKSVELLAKFAKQKQLDINNKKFIY